MSFDFGIDISKLTSFESSSIISEVIKYMPISFIVSIQTRKSLFEIKKGDEFLK